MKKFAFLLFFIVGLKNVEFAQPIISSFSPSSGQVGTTVIINGTNFNPTLANNIVFFGATKATVTSGSTTSLTVSVPIGASYQPISVTNLANRLTAYSSQSFNVTFPCGGAVSLSPTQIIASISDAGNYFGIVTGDIDGDGKVDIALIGGGTVSLYRNSSSSGTISFASPVSFGGGITNGGASIGDFDGDGKLDLAVIFNVSGTVLPDPGPNTILVFRNTSTIGTIAFDTPIYLITGTAPMKVSTGDYNKDGKPDLAVTNNGANTISIFKNTSGSGLISFAQKLDFTTGSQPHGLESGDIDGDSKPDLAVSYSNTSNVSVYKNISTTNIISFAPSVNFNTASGSREVLMGDLDGDSKLDLSVLCYSETLSVLRNTSTSGIISFATNVDIPSSTFDQNGAIGDLDGDGKLDIVSVLPVVNNSISVLRNTSSTGSISFAPRVLYASWFYDDDPMDIAMNDFDGDGKADFGIANKCMSQNGTNASLIVKRNKQFCPATTITSFSPMSGPIGTSVTIIGTNFDSTPSNNIIFFGATKAIVTSGSTTSLNVSVPIGASHQPISVTNLSTGLTAFSSKPFNVTYPCGGVINQSSLTPKVDFATGTTPFSVATGDLDNDGKPDIAVVNVGAATVSVYRNIGVGGTISYAPKVDFITGSQPYSVSLADYNGDGKLDLAVANYNSATVSIFMNTCTNGTISFSPKVDFTTNSGPSNIISNDFDGDGKTDIATANGASTSISILRNNGALGIISFAPKVDFTTGTVPYVLSSGDIDGDGKVDIAVANHNSNSVSIYRNTCVSGTISFAPKVDFTTSTQPRGITIGDIDQDGKLDVAITNYGSNSLSILRNLSNIGTISFAPKVDIATGTQPYSVSIADIDGDNKIDATVVNFGGNSISVLKNTSISGSVNFAPKVDYSTGTQPRGCAITDFDGDGKLDISIVNANSNTISFFRNLVSGVIPNVTANSSSANSICAGSSITLTGGGANTYVWTGGVTDGTSFIPPIGTSTYTVTGTVSSSGCSNTANISITSGPAVTINSSATSLCTGESITLTVTGGADSYSWNNGVVEGVSFIPPLGITTYSVSGTNTITGCQNTDSIEITVNPLPNINAGNNQTICQGDNTTLNATGATSYSWNNNVTNNVSFTPTTTNNYVVTGTDANGCQDSDTVQVTVNPSTTSQLTQTAVGSYTLNGQTYTQSGTYTQVLQNSIGCDSTITLNLTINTSGLSEINNNEISIYPNPATNHINISYNGNIEKLEIIDAKGAVVFVSKENKKEYSLPTHLQSGYYMVVIYDHNSEFRKELLINK